MAPVAAVGIDASGRCTSIHVTVRTTSVVFDGTVFNVAAQTDRFVFLEPDGANVPVSVMLPLDIATHLLYAPTIVMRTADPDAAPKKRKTLDVASLTLHAWQQAVLAAHRTQPQVIAPPLPAVLVPPPVALTDKKVKLPAATSKQKRARGRKVAMDSDDEIEDDEAELDIAESSSEAEKDEYSGGSDDADYDDDAEEDVLDDEEVDEEDVVDDHELNAEDEEGDGECDEDAKDDSSSSDDPPTNKRPRRKNASCHV